MDIEKELKPYDVPDKLIQQIRALVVRDPLTGLYNRRFFDEALTNTSTVAKRYNQPLSLILLDINDFKFINDQHGYAAGDKALQTFAGTLTKSCRDSDIICRYGGDEFTIILPNTNKPGAEILAKRISAALPHNLSSAAGIADLTDTNLLSAAETRMRSHKSHR